MNRETVASTCERAILVIALALLTFLALAFGGRAQMPVGVRLDALFLEPFVVAQWLTVVMLALWLVRIWCERKLRLLIPPVSWAVLAFTAYAVGRYLTADIEYVARQELLRVVVYAALFLIFVNNLHRQETVQIISLYLIGLAVLLSFCAVFQFFTDSNRVWHLAKPYEHRGSGTFISPNHFGGFLELILPVALSLTILGRFKALPRIFLGYAAFMILAGIAVTLSRGSWVATAGSLAFFLIVLLFHPGYRLISVGLLGLLVAAGVFLLPASDAIKSRFEQLKAQRNVEEDTRYALWQSAIGIWRENPYWGVGPAHFDHRFRERRPESVQKRPDRAHNDFLNTLADWGAVGAGLVAVAWGILALSAIKTWRFVRKVPKELGGTSQSTKAAFVVGSAAGLVAIFLHSAVDFNMHVPANAAIVVTWFALLSSHIRFATDNYWFTAGPWRRSAVSLLVVLGIGFLAWHGYRRTHEVYWQAKGLRAPDHTEARAENLKRAFRAEPMNGTTARWLGETYQRRSGMGTDDYEALAQEAITWFTRAASLNPWDSNSLLGRGWCLDWLGRCSESEADFSRAEQLSPNSYYTVAQLGLHYVQCGNYPAARLCFERSFRLDHTDNPIASQYLQIVYERMVEEAKRTTPQ